MAERVSDEDRYTCGRCGALIGPAGSHCEYCGFPNDPEAHAFERRLRALREALRPHDRYTEDEVGDVWVRGTVEYDGQPVEERTYVVENVGGSEQELLLSDGEWWSDGDLIDARMVRQRRVS